MHSHGYAVVVRRLHHEKYPGKICPDRKTFLIYCEDENFAQR
jgi:hypothetical protein